MPSVAPVATRARPESERCLQLFRKFTAGVSIVSVAGASGPHGMTASAVTSVSLDPALLLVCLDSRSATLHWVNRRPHFAVHLLGANQPDLATSFAVAGGPRFEGIEHHDVLGTPILPECLAWSVCELTDSRPYGDHHVVVGRIVATSVSEGRPLVWHDRAFTELEPATPSGGASWTASPTPSCVVATSS